MRERPVAPAVALPGGAVPALGRLARAASQARGSLSQARAFLDVTASGRMADLVELAKPSITFMVLVTAASGFLLGHWAGGSGSPVPLGLLALALLGTGLLSAGGSTLNHVVERDTDALMRRTAARPLPAGRLAVAPAAFYGVALAVAGCAVLLVAVNTMTAALGAVAFGGYVFVYTPLKRITHFATVIGAIPGAIPPLMGWTAARGTIDLGGLVLFAILFLWQLPHFLAIAWLCRGDYAQAGFPLITVVEPDGRSTARQMILYSATLVPVSLLPAALGLAGAVYFGGTLALGLLFLLSCAAFPLSYSARAARHVLLASVFYLPAILGVMMLDRAL
jgi:protoheme IX farnesyltransferase